MAQLMGGIFQRCRLEGSGIEWTSWGRRVLNNSDVNNHVVAEVLISRDQGIVPIVLKTDTRNAMVSAIKVLDCGDDGFRIIMRVYLNTQR